METSLKLLEDYQPQYSSTSKPSHCALLKTLLQYRLCMLGYLHSGPLSLTMVIHLAHSENANTQNTHWYSFSKFLLYLICDLDLIAL
jgi:hypothetical protein